MDYTSSLNSVIHAGTGHRMHQATEPVPTEVSAADMNHMMWSMMEVLFAGGIAGAAFNAADPNTYNRLRVAIQALANAVTPVGTVFTGYYGSVEPTGFVLGQGGLLNRVTDAVLWAHVQAIGVVVAEADWQADPLKRGYYSTGDGSTTFRVPMLGGQHVRILDDGAGINSGRLLASMEGDQMPAHTHTYREGNEDSAGVAGGSDANIGRVWMNGAPTGSAGAGIETRVKTVALRAIIKRW